MDWRQILAGDIFSADNLLADIIGSLNAGELAKRRFREIARISGLVFSGFPGTPKSAKQIQASSSLFYDVFLQYDPDNLLLTQARQEVLGQELELARLADTLRNIRDKNLCLRTIKRPTPFAFPLLVERLREGMSTEKLADRISRMVADLEKAAGAGGYDAGGAVVVQQQDHNAAPVARRRKRIVKTGQPNADQRKNLCGR